MLNGIMETLAVSKIVEAYKRSRKDGRLRHVVAAGDGDYRIVLRRPVCGHFWTDGACVGTWTEGAGAGVASPDILAKIARWI